MTMLLMQSQENQPKSQETMPVLKNSKILSSKIKMKFYINVQQLYKSISSLDCFKDMNYPIESLGALSIFTGNNKNPGIRHVTKTLALNVYRQASKDGLLSSLVDDQGHLTNTEHYYFVCFLLFSHVSCVP